MNRRIAIVVSFIGLNLMACCCGGLTPQKNAAAAKDSLPSTPEAFIDRFGQPDDDDSTENDKPRPLVLTRWLVYKKENVRIFFIPDDRTKGNEIPVQGWQFHQAQEAEGKGVINTPEALNRLKNRDKEQRADGANEQKAKDAVFAGKEVKPVPPIDTSLEKLIARFGAPDEDNTNENNKVLPKPVTRWIVYKKENVRVLYSAQEEKKPFKAWKFREFIDNTTKESLDEDDVTGMLSGRDSEKKRFDTEVAASVEQARKNNQSAVVHGPKTVEVKGYTTKNGTYVPPHTRSAPRR